MIEKYFVKLPDKKLPITEKIKMLPIGQPYTDKDLRNYNFPNMCICCGTKFKHQSDLKFKKIESKKPAKIIGVTPQEQYSRKYYIHIPVCKKCILHEKLLVYGFLLFVPCLFFYIIFLAGVLELVQACIPAIILIILGVFLLVRARKIEDELKCTSHSGNAEFLNKNTFVFYNKPFAEAFAKANNGTVQVINE